MRDAGKGEKNRIRLYAMREKKQSVDNLIWLAIAMEKKKQKNHPRIHIRIITDSPRRATNSSQDSIIRKVKIESKREKKVQKEISFKHSSQKEIHEGDGGRRRRCCRWWGTAPPPPLLVVGGAPPPRRLWEAPAPRRRCFRERRRHRHRSFLRERMGGEEEWILGLGLVLM